MLLLCLTVEIVIVIENNINKQFNKEALRQGQKKSADPGKAGTDSALSEESRLGRERHITIQYEMAAAPIAGTPYRTGRNYGRNFKKKQEMTSHLIPTHGVTWSKRVTLKHNA